MLKLPLFYQVVPSLNIKCSGFNCLTLFSLALTGWIFVLECCNPWNRDLAVESPPVSTCGSGVDVSMLESELTGWQPPSSFLFCTETCKMYISEKAVQCDNKILFNPTIDFNACQVPRWWRSSLGSRSVWNLSRLGLRGCGRGSIPCLTHVCTRCLNSGVI